MYLEKTSNISKFRLFSHPRIYTMNPSLPIASWMLTMGDRIIATGKDTTPPDLGQDVEIVELQGEAIIPGMIDAHCHPARYLWHYATSLPMRQQAKLELPPDYAHWLNLETVNTAEKILEHVRSKSHLLQPGTWILGGGWADLDRIPDRKELDIAAPQNPVFLFDVSLHSAIANSLVFKIAGINEDSWTPRGGRIDREPLTGEPAGRIYEQAVAMVEKNMPTIFTKKIISPLISNVMHQWNSCGLVGIHDMEQCAHYDIYPILANLYSSFPEKFTVRWYCSLKSENVQQCVAQGRSPGTGNEFLRVGPLKIIYDGSLGAGTALMSMPYWKDGKKTSYWGEELMPRGEMFSLAKDAVRHNIPLAIHTIGDRAAQNVAELFEEICQNPSPRPLRHRVEHIQSAMPDTISRLAKCGIVFSIQPIHLMGDLEHISKVQPQLIYHTHAYRTLIKETRKMGGYIALGTDFPVAPVHPLWNIYMAVTRRSPGGKILDASLDVPENHLSVYEAIESYTIGSAYAASEEKYKGSLESGKLADFVVLSKNILDEKQKPEEILNTKILATYIGSMQVYP